ncbi:hypothetical protein [uncultured Helicobacter sp.]
MCLEARRLDSKRAASEEPTTRHLGGGQYINNLGQRPYYPAIDSEMR